MMVARYRRRERGITALIIVLFTTLLLVVVTVGFMKTMTIEQRASADDELSRGAYDSALAGVEDGKRVLQACLIDKIASACAAMNNGNSCTTISDAGYVIPQGGEVYLKSNSSSGLTGQEYEQAYTCVKVSPFTKDYVGNANADESVVVPLLTTAPMSKIVVSWFISKNSTNQTNVNLDGPLNSSVGLPAKTAWPSDRPPIMRLQLIQFQNGNLDLPAFDSDGNGHTLYLYPKQINQASNFNSDVRRIGTLQPSMVRCALTFLSTYACSAEIDLPNPVGGSASDRMAYLRVTSLYVGTDFMIAPADASVKFNAQPSIDSTGRAADVFRRVEARIELHDPNDVMLYPRATVDTTNTFCKSFAVTDNLADYTNFCP